MADLSINNVISISIATPGTGIGSYNTSNLALFTRETYESSFGSDGYKIYLDPSDVATDFGSDSDTYKMAVVGFSQQPNFLANDGYLVIIPFADSSDVVEVQEIGFSATPTAGSFKLNYGGEESAAILFSQAAGDVESALQALTGLGTVTVTGTFADGFIVTFTGVSGDAALLTVSENGLDDTSGFNIDVTVSETTPGSTESTEDLVTAIARTKGLIQYFGIMCAEIVDETDQQAAAVAVQSLLKMAFFVSRTSADIETGGKLDLLRSLGYTRSRGLFYSGDDDTSALEMMAAYAARALSTIFEGSNTTQTMHLKDLTGVAVDPSMTETLLGKAQDAGVDVYCSIEGVAKTFCSGENEFFDDMYNLLWLVGELQVNGFNYLATIATKVPQTEDGMNGLKGAYRKVCEQGKTNQFLAPGEWTSPTTFGIQDDLYANVRQRGYYIYSSPVALQSTSSREAREAPLVQMAVKYAGAVHSSSVVVNINK